MRTSILACTAVLACSSRSAPLAWAPDERTAFERARAEHKGVMIDFHADWSVPSVELDRALHEPAIAAELAPAFVPLAIDVTTDSDAVAEIRTRYRSQSAPDVVFVTVEGNVIDRLASFSGNDQLASAIRRAAARAR